MAAKSGNRRRKNNKIAQYRRPLNLNIGLLIFVVIFIYVATSVFMLFRTGHIVRYEVKKGALATNNIYRGVVIREETVVPANAAGYINYYANEGERVARGDMVYIMDETGRVNEELQSYNVEKNTLTDSELTEFRSEIVNFAHGYDSMNFKGIYDFKNSLHNTVKKLANVNMLESINRLNESGINSIVNYFYAPDTGVVCYWTDGYEDLTADQVTAEVFDAKAYEEKKKPLLSNTLVEPSDAAYKLATSEKWSLVFPVEDAERGAQLEEEEYIKVRFMKNQYESWGAVKLLHNRDGNHYLQLSFTNSMITFTPDRFLEIELLLNNDTGLKIPNSAILDKEFYLIPREFVTTDGEKGKGQVKKQYVMESGEVSTKIYDVAIHNFDAANDEYYVDATVLDAGDLLFKDDGQDIFTVSKRATLTGVYNVNNGYADFRQINILAQNDEYAIVKANTQYGLNVYDYIALDAKDVRDDQFINE